METLNNSPDPYNPFEPPPEKPLGIRKYTRQILGAIVIVLGGMFVQDLLLSGDWEDGDYIRTHEKVEGVGQKRT